MQTLTVSLDKTHSTLFTHDTHQSRLDPGIMLGASPLTLDRHPKILGVIFDPHFNFSAHTKYIAERCSSRLRLLSALAGTRWGQHKETLLTTYRGLIRSIILYAAPIWYPNTSRTSILRLQRIQNSALRTATGRDVIWGGQRGAVPPSRVRLPPSRNCLPPPRINVSIYL